MKKTIKVGRNEIEVSPNKREVAFYHASRAMMHYAFYDSVKNALYWDMPIVGGLAKKALKFAQSRYKAGLLIDIYNDKY